MGSDHPEPRPHPGRGSGGRDRLEPQAPVVPVPVPDRNAPNRAAKLVRFHDAAHRLAAGLGPARAAAESGYFDQSHLHRDVRSFNGVTPAALADELFLAVDDVAWPGQAPPVTRTAYQR
jgi:hypothetical protein